MCGCRILSSTARTSRRPVLAIYMEETASNSNKNAMGWGTLVLGGKVEIKNCVNKGYKQITWGKDKVWSPSGHPGQRRRIYITYDAHINLSRQ